MAEKDEVFSSKIKYGGIFPFRDLYNFCYEWLTQETGLGVVEEKYEEKLAGDEKEMTIEWKGSKKFTDYFKFEAGIKFRITRLKQIEINQKGAKIKTNQGNVEISIKGTLVKDYEGKFETNAFQKFLRGIYEKWVITSRIEQFQDKIAGDCDEFLNQAKAYLDLEGKK